MREATWTRKLRSAAASGAVMAGAGAATALGWSGWVETEAVTGATNAQPPALPAAGALTARPALRQASVLVCQATGDGDYVLVRVLSERLDEYRRNPNNLVPAPAGGCPADVRSGEGSIPTTAAPPTQPPATTSTPTTAPPRTAPTTTTSRKGRALVNVLPLREGERSTPSKAAPRRTPRATPPTGNAQPKPPAGTSTTPSAAPPPSGAVLGSAASGGSDRRAKTYTGRLPANLKRLPNTGNETALLLFFGVDLLLLGAGLRLRAGAASRVAGRSRRVEPG